MLGRLEGRKGRKRGRMMDDRYIGEKKGRKEGLKGGQ
jgi:hypothetical protein